MNTIKQPRSIAIWAISLVAVLFGLMTIKEGGAVLFGSEEARAAAGNYVPFVLWFNFLSGFAYVVAGIGLWMQQRWAVWLTVAIVVAIAIAFTAFGLYIYSGGAFEQRTVIAMNARTLIWVAISYVAVRSLRRS
ncbi:MAG TPA: hypothetical protein VGD24_05535 [Gallionella sp.]